MKPKFKYKPVLLAATSLLCITFNASAQIDNPTVVSGSVTISSLSVGTTNIIQSTDRAIVDYARFNLQSGDTVNFQQPSSNAAILNRITGGDTSTLNGTITANGNVFFVNPAGVVFGTNSKVSAESLIAVAGNMTNADFMAGRQQFALTGSISNHGSISVSRNVVLAGQDVLNSGDIVSASGVAVMAAGDKIVMQEQGSALKVEVTGGRNNGSSARIRNSGNVSANDVMFSAGDVYSAAIQNTGRVTAKRNVKMHSNGGSIKVAGKVKSTSGGRIEIGGTDRGGDGAPRASSVTIEAGAEVTSDSTKGGHVVIWSDGLTVVDGLVSALGIGSESGGFMEISGSTVSLANATLQAGDGGHILIDPINIVIDAALAGTIQTALNANTDFSVDTNMPGADPGDITMTSGITATGTGNLTFLATNNIVVSQNINIVGNFLADAVNNVSISANITAGASNIEGNTITHSSGTISGPWGIFAQSIVGSTFSQSSGKAANWGVNSSSSAVEGQYNFGNTQTLTYTTANLNKTYGQDGAAQLTILVPSGFAWTHDATTYGNVFTQDVSEAVAGPLAFTSNAQPSTASVAGSPYAITAANVNLGYSVVATGKFTVGKAALSITANNAAKTYGQTTTFAGTEFGSTGLQNSETVGSVTLASTGAVGTASVAGSPYAITASSATGGTFDINNYDVTYNNGILTIGKALLNITANDDSKIYDGLAYSGGNGVFGTGFLNGDTLVNLGGAVAYSGTSQGAINAGNYVITASGLTSDNYTISFTDGTLTVDRRAITLTANNQTRIYGDVLDSRTGVKYDIFSGAVGLPGDLGVVNNALVAQDGVNTLSGSSQFTLTSGSFVAGEGISAVTVTSDKATNTSWAVGGYAGALAIDNVTQVNITPTGGLLVANYDITETSGNLEVSTRSVTLTANNQTRVYGDVLDSRTGLKYDIFSGVAAPGDLGVATNAATAQDGVNTLSGSTQFVRSSTVNYANGEGISAVTITSDKATNTSWAVGGYAGALVIDDVAQGNITATGGLLVTNYDISETSGNLDVSTRAVTLTANNQTRIYGDVLDSRTGSKYDIFSGAVGLPGDLGVVNNALTTQNGVDTLSGSSQFARTSSVNYANGEGISAVTITSDKATNTSWAVGGYAGALVIDNVTQGNITATGGLVVANYDISETAGNLDITNRLVTLTAANQSRIYGDVLDSRTGSKYDIFSGAVGLPGDLGVVNNALTAQNGVDTLSGSTQFARTITVNYANGEGISAVTITSDKATNTSWNVGGYAGALVIDDVTQGNITATGGLLVSNYTISETAGNLDITNRFVTLTAANQSRIYGDVLDTRDGLKYDIFSGATAPAALGVATNAPTAQDGVDTLSGSTQFSRRSPVNYANGESISAVTITSDKATNTIWNVNSYAGAIVIDDITQGNITPAGGLQVSNYTISEVTGDLAITERQVTLTANQRTRIYGNVIDTRTNLPNNGSEYNIFGGAVAPAELMMTDVIVDGKVRKDGVDALAGSTQFARNSSVNFANGESINSVTITSDKATNTSWGAVTHSNALVINDVTQGNISVSNGLQVTNYNISEVASDLVITKRPITLDILDVKVAAGTNIFYYFDTSGNLVVDDNPADRLNPVISVYYGKDTFNATGLEAPTVPRLVTDPVTPVNQPRWGTEKAGANIGAFVNGESLQNGAYAPSSDNTADVAVAKPVIGFWELGLPTDVTLKFARPDYTSRAAEIAGVMIKDTVAANQVVSVDPLNKDQGIVSFGKLLPGSAESVSNFYFTAKQVTDGKPVEGRNEVGQFPDVKFAIRFSDFDNQFSGLLANYDIQPLAGVFDTTDGGETNRLIGMQTAARRQPISPFEKSGPISMTEIWKEDGGWGSNPAISERLWMQERFLEADEEERTKEYADFLRTRTQGKKPTFKSIKSLKPAVTPVKQVKPEIPDTTVGQND